MKRFNQRKLHINYRISFQTGLILSISIFLILFKLEIRPEKSQTDFKITQQEVFVAEEVIQTKQEAKAVIPKKPLIPIEVPNDEILEDEIVFIDSELDLSDSNILPPPPKSEVIEEAEEQIFIVVEQQPVLIGGIAGLQSQVKYPKIAIEANIQGRVIVQMVIDKQGNVRDPFIVRGIGGGCDEEALRVIKSAKFKPAHQRGKPVLVQYTLPILFKIRSDQAL